MAWTARKSSQRTGEKPKAKSPNCIRRLPTSERISYTRFRTTSAKSHVVVCIEDLQVKKMSKSATKKVAQKSGLNRCILDASPFKLRRQLEYKTQWQGGLLVPVPPQNTSRKCPECGQVAAENRKSQAKFACVECGFSANADFVAAVNIREAGLASLACSQPSGDVSPSCQGPTERYPRLAGEPVGIPSLQGWEDVKELRCR